MVDMGKGYQPLQKVGSLDHRKLCFFKLRAACSRDLGASHWMCGLPSLRSSLPSQAWKALPGLRTPLPHVAGPSCAHMLTPAYSRSHEGQREKARHMTDAVPSFNDLFSPNNYTTAPLKLNPSTNASTLLESSRQQATRPLFAK